MNTREQQSLLFEGKEDRLKSLDELARRLWLGGLTNSQGCLEFRLESLSALQRTLLSGAIPTLETSQWLPASIATPLRDAINHLGIANYCAGQQELTNTVLMSLLFHLDFIVDYQDRGASKSDAERRAIEAFVQDWSERCGQLEELIDVFGQLPDDTKNTNWDEIQGTLSSSCWQDVVRIRRRLEQLPELKRAIRALGRSRQADDSDIDCRLEVRTDDEMVAQRLDNDTIRIPDIPGETRGIQRSDRIARMLPAEAVLLGHPRLRLVWHARRAERTLLTYEDSNRLANPRLHRGAMSPPRPSSKAGKKLEMGPMLICVDTSGSMQGGAEEVAKAAVLEAMRIANAQHRQCYVFAFGGCDELIEMELGLDNDGIKNIAEFLAKGFRGGTDICGALEAVIAKLEDESWQLADLLIASDGEFGVTSELISRLEAVKRTVGLRVQGALIGDRETIGFLEVADNIFPIDWRHYGTSGADSPTRSHQLKPLLFPVAVRNEKNRQSTVRGDVAAAAIYGRRPGSS